MKRCHPQRHGNTFGFAGVTGSILLRAMSLGNGTLRSGSAGLDSCPSGGPSKFHQERYDMVFCCFF